MARRNRAKSNASLSPSGAPAAIAPSPPSAVASARPTIAPSPRWHVLLAAAVIALAAIAVYWNSFSGVFVLDDGAWIGENTSIQHPWSIRPVLFPPTKVESVGGRPVVSLTLALNYWLGGENVWGYHAANLAIHILAAWTLFGLVRRTLLLPPSSPRNSSVKGAGERARLASVATPLAFAAALLWAVHPLQTGAVTYIIQRTESLVSLFYLLTIYCVVRGATSAWRAAAWYLAALLSCALGMASKEVMATVPLVALLYDRTFLGGSFRAAIARRWGLYLAMAASWGIIAWEWVFTNFHGGSTATTHGLFTRWTYLLTESQVLTHYLRLAFWPAGQCFDYGWPPAGSLGQVIWPGLFVVTLLGLTVWGLVRWPALGFLGAWFFLILAPTSSFVPILDAAVEHRMYLPLAGITVGVVLAGYRLAERFGDPNVSPAAARGAAAALAVATIALGWATVRRNAVYHSELALWQDVVDKCPNNARGHDSLAGVLHAEEKDADAFAQYSEAIRLGTLPSAHRHLGNMLLGQGRTAEALAEYNTDEPHEPNNAELQFYSGLAYSRQGDMQEALNRWRAAVRLDPDNSKYRYALAWVLATSSNPNVRDGRAAIEVAQKGIELTEGKMPAMFAALAAGYAEIGQFSQAVQTAQKAIELAIQQKNDKVANGVRVQLHLYESELPYREP